MTTTAPECSYSRSKCTVSSLTGTAIGLGIGFMGYLITGLIKKHSNRQSGAERDIESRAPDISLPFPADDNSPNYAWTHYF